MAKEIDKVDRRIINILKGDGRRSYAKIAKELGLSEGAIRKRIQRLVKSGIIRKFTISLEMKEGVKAMTLVATSPSISTSEISKRISNIPSVEAVYEITGQYDIVAILSAPTVDEVNICVDEIRRIEGVINTNTMMILRSWAS